MPGCSVHHKKDPDSFGSGCDSTSCCATVPTSTPSLRIWSDIKGYIHAALIVVALYFAFKCMKKDTYLRNVFEIILAACLSPFYIAYKLAKPCP